MSQSSPGSLGSCAAQLGMPRLDGLGRGGIGETGRLGAEHETLGLDVDAAVEGVGIEELEGERVQRRHEGDVRVAGHGVAQGERAVRGELGHEPIRQRADALVLIRLVDAGISSGARVIAGSRRGARLRGAVGLGVATGLLVFRRDRRLVLGPHIAALDPEHAGAVDADEGAGTGDLGGIIEDGPLIEGLQGRLDLAEPLCRPPRGTRRRRRTAPRGARTRP